MLLFSETPLTPAKQFELPNYECYRYNRISGPRDGSSVAVVSIAHNRVVQPQWTLETTTIDAPGAIGGVLLVIAYKPPERELLVNQLGGRLQFTQKGDHGRRPELQASRLEYLLDYSVREAFAQVR